jgi:hypothetical protein
LTPKELAGTSNLSRSQSVATLELDVASSLAEDWINCLAKNGVTAGNHWSVRFVSGLARTLAPNDRGASAMQTRCPKCTTIVKANGTDWAIINDACPELSGTEWENKPEFCPTLSHVVRPEIVLPGIASRAAVQEEIERVRVVKVRPLSQVE